MSPHTQTHAGAGGRGTGRRGGGGRAGSGRREVRID